MRIYGSRGAKRIAWFLKLTALGVLGAAVFLQLADLVGWLEHEDRQIFLRWALQSQVGLPISDPGAQAFKDRFPPPPDARVSEITHVTKHVFRLPHGPQQTPGTVMEASFNYMHRDGSRTSYVATLPEVREWASESSYPWLSWVLALVGFTEVLSSTIIDWREARLIARGA